MTGPSTAALSQSPLAAARLFSVPVWLLESTVEVLQAAGAHQREAFVVWGGTVEAGGTEVVFRSGYVPQQEAYAAGNGLLVTVSGESLFDVNRQLYAHGHVLAAQIHSHPTHAYHSDTDDCFSLVTLTGALSIVVPNFAAGGASDLTGWAWYRLTGPAQWAELTGHDRVQLLDTPRPP